MTYQTFGWAPRTEPEGKRTFRVLRAQFGDGYVQQAGDGINNETATWPLEFAGYAAQIQPIDDFLRAHQGFKPFWWTPPMASTPALFVAGEIILQPLGGDAFVLRTTFEQRFVP